MSSVTEPLEDARKWHPAQEKILKNWGEIAACYRYLHFRAYELFKRQSMRFTLPVIVLSTVTGTANFAQSTFPPAWQEYVPAAIGALNLIAAIMTTISQFLKVNELQESHRVSSIQYGKLTRTIRLELMLPVEERHKSGSTLVDSSRAEYDRLIEQSPPIPRNILNTFETFMSRLKNGHGVCTPEILDVRMIKPYIPSNREMAAVNKSLDALKNRATVAKESIGSIGSINTDSRDTEAAYTVTNPMDIDIEQGDVIQGEHNSCCIDEDKDVNPS